ncbi:GFA family protein [Rhizobium sp. ARZ01]|uniref:GFA family protein n=1 Tax=Rhizobium sp. ARZ01 TaxID=2769313 RepID=UPI00177F25F8|nr:GFA family protein [Rhizobium sp. ARZ01]MBD9375598.1 GFA family protein [Rhizobium sp. ARZ01]
MTEQTENIHVGGCRCGRVKYLVRGSPHRVGICHCTDCRQESGSAFTFFGVWPASSFSSSGRTETHQGRRFCPNCGSRLFSCGDGEAEIKMGTLDNAPTSFHPTYELWIKRRELWLAPVKGAEQFKRNRVSKQSTS